MSKIIDNKEKEEKEEKSEEEEEEEESEEEEFDKEITLSKIGGVNFNKNICLKNGLFEKGDELYTNLYPIKFKRKIIIYQYSFKIDPECHEESVILKIIRDQSYYIYKKYGYYYRSGDNIYAMYQVNRLRTFKAIIHDKGWLEYKIIIQPCKIDSVIEEGQTHNFTQVQEKMIFLIIREILSANPNVHFDRDNLYLENEKEEVICNHNSYYIHEGYKISIQQASIGICLIIGVKNKIKGKLSVLDFIKNNNEDEIYKLNGRRFIPYEGSRSQVISYIDFDRNPMNTIRNYRQETLNYYDYYDKIWNINKK